MEREKNPLSGFGKKSVEERIGLLKNQYPALTNDDLESLNGWLTINTADSMVENVVGRYELPYALATNFLVDGKQILIPMVTEESSIVAGASKAAKIFAEYGGFVTEADKSLLKGQIQIIPQNLNLDSIKTLIDGSKESLINLGNSIVPGLVNRGGGVVGVEFVPIPDTRLGPMGSVDILVDTMDAMGANIVNRICEGLSTEIGKLTESRVNIRILSNLSDKRLARAFCAVPVSSEYLLPDLAQKIVEAQVFAEENTYRAATHNKGIFNAIDAMAIATGQDFRAIEAGAHAYAARSGKYKPLTNWYIENGFLKGEIELPLAVGVVGGIAKFHRTVETSFNILGVKTAQDLSRIMASVGLAQNFAALLALVSVGIEASHIPLHKRKEVDETGLDKQDKLDQERAASEGMS